MPHREFKDSAGRAWQVWSVFPERAERRVTDVSKVPHRERRQRDEFRVALGQRWAGGWLCFETGGEKRRLAPIPSDWATASDAELERLCATAVVAHRSSRRLLE